MAHKIEISLPSLEIGSNDVNFDIRQDETKLGTLCISRGNIEWIPSKYQYRCRFSWKRFDQIMKEIAPERPVKKRPTKRRQKLKA